MTGRRTFFPSEADDAALEDINTVFWQSLVDHIDSDYAETPIGTMVDVGCHRGGFLYRAAAHWKCDHVFGIEPLEAARTMAERRLEMAGIGAMLLPPESWNLIPRDAADLVVGQEVLYLIDDLEPFFAHVARVLRPRRRAYFTLGSHTDNPLWPEWSAILRGMGVAVHDRAPLDIMRTAEAAGLRPAVRPLRRDGWIIHAPLQARFPVPNVAALCDHHYKHKLLFRFEAS